MNGETTWDVEAQMLKKYGGMWRVISVGRRTKDEAQDIQKRFERGSDMPIRVVRVETTRTVEEGGEGLAPKDDTKGIMHKLKHTRDGVLNGVPGDSEAIGRYTRGVAPVIALDTECTEEGGGE